MTYERIPLPPPSDWEIDTEHGIAITRRAKVAPSYSPKHEPQGSPPMAIAAVFVFVATLFVGCAALLKLASEWSDYSINKADIEKRALQQGYQEAISDMCGGLENAD